MEPKFKNINEKRKQKTESMSKQQKEEAGRIDALMAEAECTHKDWKED